MPNQDPNVLPSPLEVLAAEQEPLPAWLTAYTEQTPFRAEEVFASRVVYYPGSYDDGHPLRIFGKAHAAHVFVFADYLLPGALVRRQMQDECDRGHPKGYRLVVLRELREEDLTPRGWRAHVTPPANAPFLDTRPPGGPYALWAVFERMPEFSDEHGPERIALLTIGGEAVATYDALFCQEGGRAPYGLLLQDHAFGCNWTHFGGIRSPLFELASHHGMPEWLLVDDGSTHIWPGYRPVSSRDRGGMHSHERRLFRRDPSLIIKESVARPTCSKY